MIKQNVVIQEETTGCGIAAVANIVGESYQSVKTQANSLGIYADDQALWSDTQYVRHLLNQYGYQASISEIDFAGWDDLPDRALLAIKWHVDEGKPFWHWVVFKRIDGKSVVLDSAVYLEHNLRTDFDQMSPKWFIAIEHSVN